MLPYGDVVSLSFDDGGDLSFIPEEWGKWGQGSDVNWSGMLVGKKLKQTPREPNLGVAQALSDPKEHLHRQTGFAITVTAITSDIPF